MSNQPTSSSSSSSELAVCDWPAVNCVTDDGGTVVANALVPHRNTPDIIAELQSKFDQLQGDQKRCQMAERALLNEPSSEPNNVAKNAVAQDAQKIEARMIDLKDQIDNIQNDVTSLKQLNLSRASVAAENTTLHT